MNSQPNSPSHPQPDGKRVEEIRERCERATAGPWLSGGPYPGLSVCVCVGGPTESEPEQWEPVCVIDDRQSGHPTEQAKSDQQFIAHARSDIPWLLQRIAELEAELGRTALELSKWKAKAESEEARWRNDVIASREARDKATARAEELEALNTKRKD